MKKHKSCGVPCRCEFEINGRFAVVVIEDGAIDMVWVESNEHLMSLRESRRGFKALDGRWISVYEQIHAAAEHPNGAVRRVGS